VFQGRGLDGWLIIDGSILTTITETIMRDLILKILKVLHPDFDFSEVEKADDDVRFVKWFDEQGFLADLRTAVEGSRDMAKLDSSFKGFFDLMAERKVFDMKDWYDIGQEIEVSLDDRFYQIGIDEYWTHTVDEKINERLEDIYDQELAVDIENVVCKLTKL
jgi:hypothetical protein